MVAGALEMSTETELLEACGSGDREAIRELFEVHKTRVYSFALRFLNDPAQAADLTQDIFVKLFTRISDFRGESRFETWLYRMVTNACIDHQRKNRRFLPWHSETSLVTGKNLHEEQAARRQAAGVIQKAISRLSPPIRLPILLRYQEELSYEEIAAVLGISAGTVASRLNRGHKLLAAKLERFRGGI